MRIFFAIVFLSLVACSDREQQKIDSKSEMNAPIALSSVMATSSVIVASEVSSVSGITAASSSVRAPGWLDVVQLEEFRQDIEDVTPLSFDCGAAERDSDEVPLTFKTKKERIEYKRAQQKAYDLELKKCATLEKNLEVGNKLAIADFNRTWVPILKHAFELGDPIAEILLRGCHAPMLDRAGIASDCSNNEADRKFAQARFDAINFQFHNSFNCDACDEFRWFELLKKHVGVPATSAVVSTAEVAKQMREAVNEPEMVRIPGKNYEMGKYDVTQAEWRAVMGKNPSRFRGCGDTCPVEYVSWDDIQAFLTKLNQKTGKQYRLPTEEEWEYACYGGSPTQYCGSDDPDGVAWFDKNSNSTTHPVGQKQANGYGLYDMIGNVKQWMQNEDGNWHALRGGSWDNGADSISVTSRHVSPPDSRDISIGFRLARTLQ